MNLSEQFVRIAILTLVLHFMGLVVARQAFYDKISYRKVIGLWIARISLSCSLMLPLGFSYKTVHVVTELQRDLQLVRTKSTPVLREVSYAVETANIVLPSGRTVSFSRSMPRTESGSRRSDLRIGENRNLASGEVVRFDGLPEAMPTHNF